MDSLIIEGVRCFSERQTVRLRPITILTGENSTGKTTVLALTRIAWDLWRGFGPADFNEEPFVLGAYDDIASSQGGIGGKATAFMVGAQFFSDSPLSPVSMSASFTERGAQPSLSKWELTAKGLRLVLSYRHERYGSAVAYRLETNAGAMAMSVTGPPYHDPEITLAFFISGLQRGSAMRPTGNPPNPAELSHLQELLTTALRPLGPRPYAFAPVRSRPRRTYDPIAETADPEGLHIPMYLARLSYADPNAWKELRRKLAAFGRESGLFRDLDVRRMGRGEGGPFQIRVKVAGRPFNLVDVGYGVSQALPIVVDGLRGKEGSTYLLQQPEVHLHPKAQAELGSLFATLAKEHGKRFLLETHSDHLVDRVRTEVREGKLKPEDVSLLYFERGRGGVTIHEIELDTMGNIVNPPMGYRQFFLDEMRAMLGG